MQSHKFQKFNNFCGNEIESVERKAFSWLRTISHLYCSIQDSWIHLKVVMSKWRNVNRWCCQARTVWNPRNSWTRVVRINLVEYSCSIPHQYPFDSRLFWDVCNGGISARKKRTLLSPSPYLLLFSNHRVHVTQEQMNMKIFHLILAKN